MAEETKSFTPIETQEAFDTAIKDRIDRAKNSVREEYKDYEDFKSKASAYDSKVQEYEDKLTDLNKSVSEKSEAIKELKAKVAKYESDSVKTRLANEYGLLPETIEFMHGSGEKEWRESAEKLAALTKRQYPRKDTRESAAEPSLAALLQKSLLKGE